LNLRTHKRIAERLAAELNLDPRKASCLVNGLLAPDRWRDFPHHNGKQQQIRRRILEARRLYLEGNEAGALFNLGVALHYVQDAWVSLPGSHPMHRRYEEEVADAPFLPLEEVASACWEVVAETRWRRLADVAVNLELLKAKYDGLTARQVLEVATTMGSGSGSPLHDLNFAFHVSLIVALSVCGPRVSRPLQKRLSRLRDKYAVKMWEAERSLAERVRLLRAELKELDGEKGLVNSAVRFIRRISLWLNERRYRRRSHLQKVQKEYYRKADAVIQNYRDWFLVEVPELNVNEVQASSLIILLKPETAC
jgi:hypothetical protein